jgi:hypothetical protein
MRKRVLALILCLLLSGLVSAQDNTQTPYEIALERIEAARQSDATELNLNGLGLTELPPEIGNLTNLQVLGLGSNQFSTLPPEIGNLINLQSLILGEGLGGLETPGLQYNQLRELPLKLAILLTCEDLGYRILN